MLNDYPCILNSAEVMQILDISKKKLYNLIQTKQIPSYKLGRSYRFNKDTLIRHLKTIEE